uniref:Uncharacterized protein n=1 Tax=Arundo donax TaxID=35708 RepID=A0A0A8YGV7_ARUDO
MTTLATIIATITRAATITTVMTICVKVDQCWHTLKYWSPSHNII